MRFRFPDIHMRSADCKVDITLNRFEKNFGVAQKYLDSQVMTDMVPYMPMVTGTFINQTKAISASMAGTGYVCAAAPPYGRFLYYGNVMVAPNGSTWAKAAEKKVTVSQFRGKTNAKEKIQYTNTFHPEVTEQWFEAAKKKYKKDWVRLVKQKAGDG